jgi:hypothetical protein
MEYLSWGVGGVMDEVKCLKLQWVLVMYEDVHPVKVAVGIGNVGRCASCRELFKPLNILLVPCV